MIDCIEATAIPVCMVGLLYALPDTQLTRRLAHEGRLSHPTRPAFDPPPKTAPGISAQTGLNFDTARPRREILADYRAVLARIYAPSSYFRRVRQVMRLLDRPELDKSRSTDIPRSRLFGIPLRRHDSVVSSRVENRVPATRSAAAFLQNLS